MKKKLNWLFAAFIAIFAINTYQQFQLKPPECPVIEGCCPALEGCDHANIGLLKEHRELKRSLVQCRIDMSNVQMNQCIPR